MSAIDQLITDGNRQRNSQEGSHVVLDGPEWDLLLRTISTLTAERDGLHEILSRYEEIKAQVFAQVIAGDAIRRAAE